MLVSTKNNDIPVFYTPPMQNHCFWVPMEVKMEPQRRLEAIFIAIENDDRKAMLFRKGVSRGRCVNTPPGKGFWAPAEEGI